MQFSRRPSDAECVIRIIVSFVVIVFSIAAIFIVFKKVTSIKMLEKINLKEDAHDSLKITIDAGNTTSMFITDEKGVKFRKEDNSFAREEWIEKNGELFYFDTAGYGINDELRKDGQIYMFEAGKLKSIKRDTSYVTRAVDELYSSVASNQYTVWLNTDEKEKGFYPIMYKENEEGTEDYLGTKYAKQYASQNMIKIYMSNIYYLAVGKGIEYAGRLCRMRPGAVHKEVVGVGVTGFIVISDDVVYYCEGEKVIKAKNWKSIELDIPEEEEILETVETEVIPIISTKSDALVDFDYIDLDSEKKKKETTSIKETTSVKKYYNETNKTVEDDFLNSLPVPDKEERIVETSVDSSKGEVVSGPKPVLSPR